MFTFTDYENFMEALATDYKPIGHSSENKKFASMDIEDILAAMRGEIEFNSPVMILENYEGTVNYKHDGLLDRKYGAFHILQHVTRNDPAQKRAVIDSTFIIGMKIISKIQLLRKNRLGGNLSLPRFLTYFNFDDVKYNKISNVFDGCHGWRFEFGFGQEDPLPYDADEWFSNDPDGLPLKLPAELI
ncbi:hypothetical protein [Belliella pelovolcani]|uniref:hypothetical protein n=1 Tax=Belliella pelovolcani TaxID=529505 RepID=UPI00391C39A1